MNPLVLAAVFGLALVFVILAFLVIATYNDVVALERRIDKAWANIDVALKQRWERFNKLSRDEKAYQLTDGMLRYGPYAMFALLPAVALVLQLLYMGRHRRYPERPRLYGEHMVFAAHNHAFLFVAGTVVLLSPLAWLRSVIVV